MVTRATSDTAHFFSLNKKTVAFGVFGVTGIPLVAYVLKWDAVRKEEIWSRVTLGLAPIGVLTVMLLCWNLERASVLMQRFSKPDYWR